MARSGVSGGSKSRWILILALAGTVVAAGVALADPVLHEFFIIPPDERGGGAGGGAVEGEGGASAEVPEELAEALRDPSLPPPLTIENRGDELELDADGELTTPTGEQAPAHNGPFDTEELARPDRQTTLDSVLTYFTVFNPSVVPWKRVSSRDEVHSDYSLGVRRKDFVYKLGVVDKPVRQGHQRFWGSMLVHMSPGKRIPLPSVAPRADILRYQTEPPAQLEFYRDAADNYFVEGKVSGTVRLNYLMETDASYFGGPIDPSIAVKDLSMTLRPKLPRGVKDAADRAIEIIGVDRSASMAKQLDTLVAYFRSFEAKDFPSDQKSEDIYLDLVVNKLGVCRHRAFAFTVTAHGLGILSRYVHNEAHAFVEVLVPTRGWIRIDLGGAAVDFNVRNASDKILHTPPEGDSFPQPENFANSYSNQLSQGEDNADIDNDGSPDTISGVPDRAGAPLGPGDQPQGEPMLPGESVEGEGIEGEPGDVEEETPAFPEGPDSLGESFEPGPSTPSRRGSTLTIVDARASVYRGEEMTITGKLVGDGGAPVAGAAVEAFLVPKGRNTPEDFTLIGKGVTNDDGQVELGARIPQTVALGRWSLYLYFRGSEAYLPSHSQ